MFIFIMITIHYVYIFFYYRHNLLPSLNVSNTMKKERKYENSGINYFINAIGLRMSNDILLVAILLKLEINDFT